MTNRPVKKVPGYVSWLAMHQRCRRNKSYISKGITVCDRWKTAAQFFIDMGERPSGMTIGRIDNELGYSPENCRWETPKQQARNRRGNLRIFCRDEVMTLSEVAERTGISRDTLKYRVNAGRSNVLDYGVRRAVTHCKHGHEFNAENTYFLPDGSRGCRTCNREKMRRRRALAREAVAA